MMDSADLFLTKPGGISVSEAAVKQLPMVLIDAVAGCESGNLRFFLDKGAARTAGSAEELAKLCTRLLQNKAELSKMAEERLSVIFCTMVLRASSSFISQ